jgi:hypothetical protein
VGRFGETIGVRSAGRQATPKRLLMNLVTRKASYEGKTRHCRNIESDSQQTRSEYGQRQLQVRRELTTNLPRITGYSPGADMGLTGAYGARTQPRRTTGRNERTAAQKSVVDDPRSRRID